MPEVPPKLPSIWNGGCASNKLGNVFPARASTSILWAWSPSRKRAQKLIFQALLQPVPPSPRKRSDCFADCSSVRMTISAFERPEEFQTLRDGRLERDDLPDDQALFIHLPDAGLVVLTGCAHAGIVNTVQFGLELTGVSRLSAVIGGFHLTRATPDRIRQTVEALQALEPDFLAPLHCTGEEATAELSRAFGTRLHYAHVGSEFQFTSGCPTAP